MSVPTPDHQPDTPMVACAGCRRPTPRRWLVSPNHCDHCQQVRSRVDKLIAWRYDEDWRLVAVDPLGALTDLHTGRVAINQLIRTAVRQAREADATWEQIGAAIHLDPRDARARYE